MKIRQGFVSNSSSSSFIIAGIKLDGKLTSEELARKYITEEAIEEFIGDDIDKFEGENKDDGWWDDLWHECAWNGDFIKDDMDFIQDESRSFLGKILADDDELEEGEISIEGLSELIQELDFGDQECKIYFGTRVC